MNNNLEWDNTELYVIEVSLSHTRVRHVQITTNNTAIQLTFKQARELIKNLSEFLNKLEAKKDEG